MITLLDQIKNDEDLQDELYQEYLESQAIEHEINEYKAEKNGNY